MSGPDQSSRTIGGARSGGVAWGPRILGLLALIAVLLAIFVVVTTSGEEGGGTTTPVNSGQEQQQQKKKTGSGADNPRFYAVQSGDTLTGIAAEFDVSTKRLLRLNPGIDPQALATGTELKIR